MSKIDINSLIDEFNDNLYELVEKENELEIKRKEFVNDYSINVIKKMTKTKYCIGYKKETNNPKKYRTFCYRLEIELKDLGDFRSRYGDRKFEVRRKYKKFVKDKKRYKDVDEAFIDTKKNIVNLIQAGKQKDYDAIINNKLYSLYKYKLLNVYYPDDYQNIYSETDINNILNKLKINYQSNASFLNKQELLYNWKNNNKRTRNWSNYMLMIFLYTRILKKNNKKINTYNYEKNYETSINDEINIIGHTYNKKFVHEKKYTTKKPVAIKRNGVIVYYKRDIDVSLQALSRANYKCECSCHRALFVRSKDNTNYVEAHHLIPMSAQKKYRNRSLDLVENVISLCSSCHNEIHYGKNKNLLIKKLYKKRKQELKDKGIDISLSELLSLYNK